MPALDMVSDETLERLYRRIYWRHNELELVRFDFDSPEIRAEIARAERKMRRLEERLGYVPAA